MKQKAMKTKLWLAVICLLVSLAVTIMPAAAFESTDSPNVAAEQDSETVPEVEQDSGTVPEVEEDSETVPEVEEDSETVPEAEENSETVPKVEENNLKKYGISVMALRPDEVDLKSEDTKVNKVDESKDRYEMPDNTSYVILKQAKGTIVVWSTDPVGDENQSTVKDQLLEITKAQDGSIKGDETVVFISGRQSFDLGEMLGQKQWGIYDFKVTDSGEVILTCDASKISHIDYITSSKNKKDPEPEPTTKPTTEPTTKPTTELTTEPTTEPTTKQTTAPKKDTHPHDNPKTGDRGIHIITATAFISMVALLSIVWIEAKQKRKQQ